MALYRLQTGFRKVFTCEYSIYGLHKALIQSLYRPQYRAHYTLLSMYASFGSQRPLYTFEYTHSIAVCPCTPCAYTLIKPRTPTIQPPCRSCSTQYVPYALHSPRTPQYAPYASVRLRTPLFAPVCPMHPRTPPLLYAPVRPRTPHTHPYVRPRTPPYASVRPRTSPYAPLRPRIRARTPPYVPAPPYALYARTPRTHPVLSPYAPDAPYALTPLYPLL